MNERSNCDNGPGPHDHWVLSVADRGGTQHGVLADDRALTNLNPRTLSVKNRPGHHPALRSDHNLDQ